MMCTSSSKGISFSRSMRRKTLRSMSMPASSIQIAPPRDGAADSTIYGTRDSRMSGPSRPRPRGAGTVRVMTAPSRAASKAENNPAVRILARVGLATIGLLHILIGAIALAIAFGGGGGGSADQSGALQALVAVPGGLFAIWVCVVGLVVLALWQILVAVRARKAGTRLVELGKCVVYAALAVIAVSVALGSAHDSSSSEKTQSARLL